MHSPLPDSPRLALCIATVGRITELDRLLTSLEQQTCTDFHIYLADQNAPGTLDAMLQKHEDLQITRILLPSKGVSIARNALLSLVEDGDIIIFPDHLPHPTLGRIVKSAKSGLLKMERHICNFSGPKP